MTDPDDIHDEPNPRHTRRPLLRCNDGMCGAVDCPRCYPNFNPDPETPDDEGDDQ